jgi:unsaturated chondroitin disaccharide hydrolase
MNLDKAIEYAAKVTKDNLETFAECFPGDQSNNLIYPKMGNVSWTTGFYEGILWLLYELTGDKAFYNAAKAHSKMFTERLDKEIELDHHDMGFLFTLSSVADYKITGDEQAKKDGIRAADHLMKRYQPVGNFIQAWGPMGQPDCYRLIVDCLLNVPLLFWASETTGDKKYSDVAKKHIKTTLNNAIREDGSSYHTFYFDPKTGAPVKGVTAQGYADDSCWARGQAWAVYGTALAYRYTKDEAILDYYNKVTKCFISKLPEDYVPYWDMCFSDGSGQPRDTSAAAIAICGIIEMNKYFPNPEFMEYADKMLESLESKYTTEGKTSNGILSDAMYNRNNGDNPECNIWGDYFYIEALMRKKNPDWKLYW